MKLSLDPTKSAPASLVLCALPAIKMRVFLILASAAITVISFWRWSARVNASRGKVGPVGQIHSMVLVFGVMLPSGLVLLALLLWGLVTWIGGSPV